MKIITLGSAAFLALHAEQCFTIKLAKHEGSYGCLSVCWLQLEAVCHYRRSVKKIVGSVMQNGDFDSSSILEKNALFIPILKITSQNRARAILA